jgi:hypothetical protein
MELRTDVLVEALDNVVSIEPRLMEGYSILRVSVKFDQDFTRAE